MGAPARDEAAKRLGWIDLFEDSRALVPDIAQLTRELRAEGVDRVVLAGMGGSSLAPEVIAATAGVELEVLDSTDPLQVSRALERDLERTVLVVSSKSGSTVETDSQRRVVEAAFRDAGIDPRTRLVAVTDPGSPLHAACESAGWRAVFTADPTVGGRFSALTAFGLVPTGLAGVDVAALLDDAEAVLDLLIADDEDNPGLQLGAALGGTRPLRDKLVFADHGSGIAGLPAWIEQLIAESTGKDGTGLLPVVVAPATRPCGTPRPAAGAARRRGRRRGPGPRRAGRRLARRPAAAVGGGHRGGRPPARDQPLRPAGRGGRQGRRPHPAGRPRRRAAGRR